MTVFSSTPIHTDMVVKDLDASIEFYTQTLGYSVVEDAVVQGPVVAFLSCANAQKMRLVFLSCGRRTPMIELIYFEEQPGELFAKSRQGFRNISLSFLVHDLAETIQAMKGRGAKPASEIFDVTLPKLGATRIIFFEDPNGYLIEFVAQMSDGGPRD